MIKWINLVVDLITFRINGYVRLHKELKGKSLFNMYIMNFKLTA